MARVARLKGWSTTRYLNDGERAERSYAFYRPGTIRNGECSPLIVALHGREGNMYEFVFSDIAKLAARYQYVIACPAGEEGPFHLKEGEEEVLSVIEHVKRRQPIDRTGIYLLGISMGARGAIYIGFRNRGMFAGIASIYGAATGQELLTGNDVRVPVFVAHGARDGLVPASDSLELVDKLRSAGCEYRFRLIEGGGHDRTVLNGVLPETFLFFEKHRSRRK